MPLFLLYFGSNKCRLGEQKRLLEKTLQIVLFKNFCLVVYKIYRFSCDYVYVAIHNFPVLQLCV